MCGECREPHQQTQRGLAARLLLPRLRSAVAVMERDLAAAPPPEPPSGPSGLAAWTSTSKEELGGEFIASLARGLTVVTAFGQGRAELTLSEVAERTGLPRATARRALITLRHLGHVTADGRAFRLTPRVLALGFPPLSKTTLTRIARTHLAALTPTVGDSTSLAVLADDEVQCVLSEPAGRIMDVDITVGTRVPVHATSAGRILLASLSPDERSTRLAQLRMEALTAHTVTRPTDFRAILERVREDGYALVDEELEEGLRSISVPVRGRDGAVLAALNVHMHSGRRSAAECVATIVPELRATAARVEDDLHVTGRFVSVPVA